MEESVLSPSKVAGEGFLAPRSVNEDMPIGPGDPAILAITDFTRETPITVDEDRPIDAALEDMIRFGVRALLVLRDRRIVGLITSYDIQGERPLQFLQNSTYEHHRDVRVGHIMTPWSELLALDWDAVRHARAGDLLEALRRVGRTHLLLVERGADRRSVVRGLASRARFERQVRPSRENSVGAAHAST
jgi:CBS domain-containing protein